MEQVVEKGGTATRASLVGYRVSGKTGTAFKSIAGGYSTDRIMAVFAGLVPASHPKLATVVVIDEPSRDVREVGTLAQGGTVAAPVFANVMSGALRLMDVPPDDLQNVPAATLVQASGAMTASRSQWLLDGIAAVPAERRAGRGSHARQPRRAAGSLFFALRGRRRTAWSSPPMRPRAARARCCGSPRPGSSRRPSRGRSFAAPVDGSAPAGRAASPIGSFSGRPRSCASSASPAPTARPPARICSRSASSGSDVRCRLHGHARLGTPRRARDADPHHARRGERAPHARAAQGAGRARGRHGGVLARARSGPRRRRALSFAPPSPI